MKDSYSISCLPIAGIGNPYQKLMMEGLMSSGLVVQHGQPGKFFAFTRSAIKHKPNYIHLDWLHSYYLRRAHWMTWLLYPVFVLDVLLAKYVFGTRFVWTLHNIFPHDRPQFGPYKWARTWFARHCEWIRVFDEGTVARASKSLKIPRHKFRVVPEGSYVGYYKDEITVKEARDKLGIGPAEKILLYLGLIKPYKGVLELVQILKKLKLDNVRLFVAGKAMDKSYWNAIQNELPAPVLLAEGFVAEDDLQIYFRAADIVILPFQRIENSGSTILAMGFSKPVIAPRKGVLVERLEQQQALLYEEVKEMPNIIQLALAKSKRELKEIGDSNFAALQQYKWEDFSALFER